MANNIPQSVQRIIDNLIAAIRNSEEPESVTNEMVGSVLEYLNEGYKDVKNDRAAISLEADYRRAADTEIRGLIANLYTKSETDQKIAEGLAELVGEAPETLDTLEELAQALQNNDSVTAAINQAIATKADAADVYNKTEIDGKESAINTAIATKANAADVYTKEQVDNAVNRKVNVDNFNQRIYGQLSNADVERMRKRGVVIIHGYGAQYMGNDTADAVYLVPPVPGRTIKAYVYVGDDNWYGYTYGELNSGDVANDGYYIDRYSSILYRVSNGQVERLSIQNQALMLDEWNTASIEALERDLAQYSEETPIALYSAQTGKYVDLGGNIQSASGWAISERVRLKKGYTYLYRPSNGQPIAQSVALVSRITTETTSVLIDYTYTYDSQGRIATATADYNGAVYTYTYNEDDVPTITDSSANVVPSLPMVRVVEANERVAMFKSLSDAMPKSGYYAILCNEDCEAEVSAPAPLGELRVVSYGFIRSIVNQKEDKAVVKQLQEKVEALEAERENAEWERIDSANERYSGQQIMYVKLKAGTSFLGATASPTHDTWVKTTSLNSGFVDGDHPQVLEVAYCPPYTGDATAHDYYAMRLSRLSSVRQLRVAEAWDVSQMKNAAGVFGGCTNLQSLDLSSWNCANLVKAPNILSGCKNIKRFVATGWNAPRLTNVSLSANNATNGCGVVEVVFDNLNAPLLNSLYPLCSYATRLKSFKMRDCTFSNSVYTGCIFSNCYCVSDIDFSGTNINTNNLIMAFCWCASLTTLDLSTFDTRQIGSNGFQNWIFNANALKYIQLSPKFFLTKVTIPLNLSTLGFEDSAKTTSNGWLEHIASTAPTIRSKEGYGEDPDIPLLEEENGEWYINDGVGRSLQLASNLKSKSWAAQYIAQLNAKGYTIS